MGLPGPRLAKDNEYRRPRCWFGGVASTCVACVVAPFDLIKTHMQTQAEKKSMLKTALNVIKLRGYVGFYDGFPAAAARQMVCTSLRFSIYESGKNLDIMNDNMASKIVLASVAGTIGSFVGIPLDVVNIRMQTDMKYPEGDQRRYNTFIHALFRIPKEEGWKSLYNGGLSAVVKAAVSTIGQIAVYDQVKHEFQVRFGMEDTVRLHFLSSFISSMIDSVITQPFDVLKTLMMNAKPGDYPSVFHAIKHMMRFGYLSPYRGLAPTMIRKAPATILLYLIYEQLRIRLGYLPIDAK